jgi:DNA-binding MarR family transcriptional regulator
MMIRQRDRTSILISTIARMTRVRFDQQARALGLTRPQWQALNCIIFCEGATLTEVAEAIEVEPITAGRLIDGLEAMGLVERRVNAADRRIRPLHLTPGAQPIIAQLRRLSDETEAELYDGVSSADMDTLERVLAAIHRNIAATLEKDRRKPATTRARQADQDLPVELQKRRIGP